MNGYCLVVQEPVIDNFMLQTGRNKIYTTYQRKANDLETGGTQRFIVFDKVAVALGKRKIFAYCGSKRTITTWSCDGTMSGAGGRHKSGIYISILRTPLNIVPHKDF